MIGRVEVEEPTGDVRTFIPNLGRQRPTAIPNAFLVVVSRTHEQPRLEGTSLGAPAVDR